MSSETKSTPSFWVTPKRRCLVTLGLVCAGCVLSLHWAGTLGRGDLDYMFSLGFLASGPTRAVVLVLLFVHVPISLFLPLFITARKRVLTPVTLLLSFSISAGMLCFVAGSVANLQIQVRGGLFDLIMGFDLIFLLLWIGVSLFQSVVFAQFGFPSSLPGVFIAFALLTVFLTELGLLVAPLFSGIYTLMAIRGLLRVKQQERRAIRPDGGLSSPMSAKRPDSF